MRKIWYVFVMMAMTCPGLVRASGGPLGIDHQLGLEDHGLWKRKDQKILITTIVLADVGAALWEGGESRVGRTLWQSIDSMLLSGVGASAGKEIFTRSRPSQTGDPCQWFQGRGHYSFPSGEVSVISGAVTPFILEYHKDHPAVWALELLPAYDAFARMKSRGHWQTDVLAGFALGTAAGYYAHTRDSPWTLSVLPNGFMVGFHKQW